MAGISGGAASGSAACTQPADSRAGVSPPANSIGIAIKTQVSTATTGARSFTPYVPPSNEVLRSGEMRVRSHDGPGHWDLPVMARSNTMLKGKARVVACSLGAGVTTVVLWAGPVAAQEAPSDGSGSVPNPGPNPSIPGN